MSGRNVPPISQQVWGTTSGSTVTAAATGAAGVSAIVNTENSPFVSAFGHVSGATTISLLYSNDGVNFYVAHTVAPSGAADFDIDCMCGAQFVQLSSSNGVNAAAWVAAKG